MNASTMKLGGAAAVVLAVGAIWASSGGSGKTSVAGAGELVYPDLLEAITGDRVASLKVETATESFTIDRMDDGWGMVERGGYPVEFDKVKEIVNAVAYFKVVEEKTANPTLYDRLHVEDVEIESAKGSKVTIADDGGNQLASIILGKPNPARGGGIGTPTLYVRRAGEERSWEVAGKIYVNTTPTNWLDKQICRVERERVHKATTTHADGEVLAVVKERPDLPNYELLDVPADTELKWAGVADSVGGALENFTFEDVQADDGSLSFEGDNVTVTDFQTFDGLTVSVKVLQQDEKSYIKVDAAFDEANRVAIAPEVEEEPEDVGPEEPTEGEDAQASDTPAEPEVPGPPAEAVAEEATQLAEKLGKWVYVLPGYQAANFSKRMTDMLKIEEPASPATEPTAPESGIGPLPPGMEQPPAPDEGAHSEDDGHDHSQDEPQGGGE